MSGSSYACEWHVVVSMRMRVCVVHNVENCMRRLLELKRSLVHKGRMLHPRKSRIHLHINMMEMLMLDRYWH